MKVGRPTFAAVGNVIASATASALSLPAIWQHIQTPDNVCRVRQFEKSGRQVPLTPVSTRLYEAPYQILVSLESTFDVISDSGSEPSITLVTDVRMMIEGYSPPLQEFRQ